MVKLYIRELIEYSIAAFLMGASATLGYHMVNFVIQLVSKVV